MKLPSNIRLRNTGICPSTALAINKKSEISFSSAAASFHSAKE
jgi:hypothetical protein